MITTTFSHIELLKLIAENTRGMTEDQAKLETIRLHNIYKYTPLSEAQRIESLVYVTDWRKEKIIVDTPSQLNTKLIDAINKKVKPQLSRNLNKYQFIVDIGHNNSTGRILHRADKILFLNYITNRYKTYDVAALILPSGLSFKSFSKDDLSLLLAKVITNNYIVIWLDEKNQTVISKLAQLHNLAKHKNFVIDKLVRDLTKTDGSSVEDVVDLATKAIEDTKLSETRLENIIEKSINNLKINTDMKKELVDIFSSIINKEKPSIADLSVDTESIKEIIEEIKEEDKVKVKEIKMIKLKDPLVEQAKEDEKIVKAGGSSKGETTNKRFIR